MSFANPTELAGAICGFILTCLVLSYIFGDNPLFRFSIHLFIGVSAGFAGAVILRNVILPNLVLPLYNLATKGASFETALALAPLLLSVLLLTKLSPYLDRLGNVSMAFLVGVGAAIAIGGATMGTLFPQVGATIDAFDLQTVDFSNPVDGLIEIIFTRFITIVGVLTTFIYFHFGARPIADSQPQRARWIETIAGVGRSFIALTFGVLFAGVYTATLTALIERVRFLWTFVISFL
ncbi:MAG: hypothetical protein ACE5GO_02390 [Anaerolineales bacterium]